MFYNLPPKFKNKLLLLLLLLLFHSLSGILPTYKFFHSCLAQSGLHHISDVKLLSFSHTAIAIKYLNVDDKKK